MDLRLTIAALGGFIALLSVKALFTDSNYRTSVGDLVCGVTLVMGIVTGFTAPVLSGLIRYTTAGTFQFTWWW
jgi:hypothetical protein